MPLFRGKDVDGRHKRPAMTPTGQFYKIGNRSKDESVSQALDQTMASQQTTNLTYDAVRNSFRRKGTRAKMSGRLLPGFALAILLSVPTPGGAQSVEEFYR